MKRGSELSSYIIRIYIYSKASHLRILGCYTESLSMEFPTFRSKVLLYVQGQANLKSIIMLVQGQALEDESLFFLCLTLNLKMKHSSPSKRQKRRT